MYVFNFLILLTEANYSSGGYQENLFVTEDQKMFDSAFRKEIINTRGQSYYDGWGLNEDFQDIKTYLRIIEYAVNEHEKKCVEKIEKKIHHLTEKEIVEFWSLHYPYQFEHIVKAKVHYSSFISIMSLAELHLKRFCDLVAIILKSKLKCKDLVGSELERAKKFLKIVGGFNNPNDDYWNQIYTLQRLRNIFIHENGVICHQIKKNGISTEENLISIIKRNNFLTVDDHCEDKNCVSYVQINTGFCEECLSFVQEFFESLKIEIAILCENTERFVGI
jgi:hypothetical protein